MSKPLAAKSVGACSRACSHPPAQCRFASPSKRDFYARSERNFEPTSVGAPFGFSAMLLNLDETEPTRCPALSADCPLPPDFDLVRSTPKATWSLADLYREHRRKLRSFFRVSGSAGNAEDLVQDAFVRIAEKAHARTEIDQPRAYINQVARNLLNEQARFAARRSAALHISHDDAEIAGYDPVAQLEARDMLARLEEAMAKMKPATREIFMAHRINGCTYSEIALSTGRSVKSVENHMAKAIYLINRAMRRS